MRQEVVPVNQQLNTLLQQQIAKNREIISSLFKTVIFCGRNNTGNNIPLRAQMHPRRMRMADILQD